MHYALKLIAAALLILAVAAAVAATVMATRRRHRATGRAARPVVYRIIPLPPGPVQERRSNA